MGERIEFQNNVGLHLNVEGLSTSRHHFTGSILTAGRRYSSLYSRYGVNTSSIHFMKARTRRDRLLR